jgi:hypothetical protein
MQNGSNEDALCVTEVRSQSHRWRGRMQKRLRLEGFIVSDHQEK